MDVLRTQIHYIEAPENRTEKNRGMAAGMEGKKKEEDPFYIAHVMCCIWYALTRVVR